MLFIRILCRQRTQFEEKENFSETPLFSRAIAMSSTMNLESEEKQVNRSHVLAAMLGVR